MTHELSQSAPAYKHTSLDRPMDCLSSIAVSKKHVAVSSSKTTVKAPWGCTDRSVSLTTRGVGYFACQSLRSCLSAGEMTNLWSMPWVSKTVNRRRNEPDCSLCIALTQRANFQFLCMKVRPGLLQHDVTANVSLWVLLLFSSLVGALSPVNHKGLY